MSKILTGPPLPVHFWNSLNQTVGSYILEYIRQNEDRVYMINGETKEQVTLSQLSEQSLNLAAYLQSLGCRSSQTNVAIYSENHINYMIAQLGIWLSGSTPATLNYLYTYDELKHAVNIVKPTVLMCTLYTYSIAKETLEKNKHVKHLILLDNPLLQIEVKRLNLTSEKDEYEAILKQKYRNILEIECSLNKLVKLQRKLRIERDQSINKWEWLIQVITSRDQEVTRLPEEMIILAEISTNLKNRITEQKNFYHEQTRCNIRANIDIRREEAEFSKQSTRKEILNSQLEQLESKIVDYRTNLSSLNIEISKRRTRITNTKKIVDQETIKVREMTSRNEDMMKKRMQTKTLYRSVEERIKELAHILQDEKVKLNVLESNCKKFEVRLQKQNFSLADNEQHLLAYDYEIEELKHAKVRLDADNQRFKQHIERQTDIILNLKQQLNELVKHIQYIKGDKINQMVNEQKNYLSNISAFRLYQVEILAQVEKDLLQFQFETTALEKTIAHNSEQMSMYQSEKEKLLLQMDGYEHRLNATIELNQQKLVSENITRTKVDHLENTLAKSADKMLNLQKQKIEIDTLFRKHNLEMTATGNILKIRKKIMYQEISNIKHPIEQIKRRIHQQMKRYEIICNGIKKDDKGVPLNITNYKIQMTKERCALLEKGDELDALVRKAEKEIQAMENTLTLLNASNNVCKHNSSITDENGKEMIKYEEKKQQKLKLFNAHKKIEIMTRKMENEISRYEVILRMELLSKLDQLKKTKERKDADLTQTRRAADEQLFKIERVNARIKRLKKMLKMSQINSGVLEREFRLKEVSKLNKRVIQRITQLINQYIELSTSVNHYLSTKGIILPQSL